MWLVLFLHTQKTISKKIAKEIDKEMKEIKHKGFKLIGKAQIMGGERFTYSRGCNGSCESFDLIEYPKAKYIINWQYNGLNYSPMKIDEDISFESLYNFVHS